MEYEGKSLLGRIAWMLFVAPALWIIGVITGGGND